MSHAIAAHCIPLEKCPVSSCFFFFHTLGWSGGAMVLGKLPVPGRPTIWITVGQGPTALTVGAGGGCLDIFTLIYPFSPLSPSLWEMARYRLKYCLKGPLNPKQPTNHLPYFYFPYFLSKPSIAYLINPYIKRNLEYISIQAFHFFQVIEFRRLFNTKGNRKTTQIY